MEEKEMYIVNWDTKSRIGEGGRRDSNIDLIFCSENIYDEIKYKQVDDSWGSDHFPIELEIGIEKRIYKKRSNRVSSAKTDWKEYKRIIIEMEEELDKEEYKNKKEEDKYNFLIKAMKNAVSSSSCRSIREENGEEDNNKDKNINKSKNSNRKGLEKEILLSGGIKNVKRLLY